MKEYDLSIIIPARHEEFLGRTVDDLLAHKEGKTQIIVGLDGEWPIEPLKDHPDLVVLHYPESIGQRAITNRCVEISKSKYIMKVDAHCAFDQGFDVKMMADMKDDWTMAPTMRNLHVFNWKCEKGHTRYQGPSGPCKECGLPTVKDFIWNPKHNPASTTYCFDPEPHFQYFNEFKSRTEYKNGVDGDTELNESMSLQGSCFMLTRDKYWELNICDEAFGTWGSQGIEVACKTWLTGGRIVISHKTWYAHCFRTQGGDFGFPYELSGKQVSHAKHLAKDIFFGNRLPNAKRQLHWLVEKFWPVPGWSEQHLTDIGGKIPTVEANSVPTKGILYYTDNQLNMKLARTVRREITKSGLPITSVSLKPLNFGNNIHFKGERGYLTLYSQILTGLKAMKEDVVFFCEHDDLYHPSYFSFTPDDRNAFYYNTNYWFLRLTDGFAIHYNVSPLSGLVVYRDIAIKHFEERVEKIKKEGFSYHMGFEPMTHHRIKWDFMCPMKTFHSSIPTVDLCHENNVTRKRWRQDQFRRKPEFWEETQNFTIPHWPDIKALLA